MAISGSAQKKTLNTTKRRKICRAATNVCRRLAVQAALVGGLKVSQLLYVNHEKKTGFRMINFIIQ